MAKDKVIVTVKVPDSNTGGLHIDVSRWSHKLSKKTSDEVEFEANGAAMEYIEVSWMPGECPFNLPENRLYVLGGTTGTTGPVVHVPPNPPQTVRYWITVYFKDPAGKIRYVDIDPDMVIDA